MAGNTPDPLLLLRQAIAAGTPVMPTATDDADAPETALSQAKFLQFGSGSGGSSTRRTAVPVDVPTRFHSHDAPVDLRSIYFAWLNREEAIPEYNAATTRLNEALAAAGSSAAVHKFAFVERLDLITWLEGASEESEYIQAAGGSAGAGAGGVGAGAGAAGVGTAAGVGAGAAAAAGGGSGAASGAAGGAKLASGGGIGVGGGTAAGASGRGIMPIDPRLAIIYSGERRMSDHNRVLRGIKPTDFSHVRKLAVPFLAKRAVAPTSGPGANGKAGVAVAGGGTASLPLNPKAASAHHRHPPHPAPSAGLGMPVRRPDPIILLSPSASSLLRMSNIKAFLETGRYVPPDNSSTATMLHLTRTMKEIDPTRPLRFILVDGPEHFKPEYWNRVVAVFTTGQAWQFKNYKWPLPAELFRHVLGVYVGWRGEPAPPGVRDWGHRVLNCAVDKWSDPSIPGAEVNRWRDREVAESIWKALETSMRQKGWRRDSGASRF